MENELFTKNEQSIAKRQAGSIEKIDDPKAQESFFGAKALNTISFGLSGFLVDSISDRETKSKESGSLDGVRDVESNISASSTLSEPIGLIEDDIKVTEVSIENKPPFSEVLTKLYERDSDKIEAKIVEQKIEVPVVSEKTEAILNQAKGSILEKVNAQENVVDKANILKEAGLIDTRVLNVHDSLNKNGKAFEGRPELKTNLENDVNAFINKQKAAQIIEPIAKASISPESQKIWLEKNIVNSDIASQAHKFSKPSKEDAEIVKNILKPETMVALKLVDVLNGNIKKLTELGGDKEGIKKMEAEVKKLSEEINKQALPQIKELGHDIVGIETMTKEAKEATYKLEQKLIHDKLEQKLAEMSGGGGMGM